LKPLESPDEEDIRIGADALVSVGLDPGDRRPITRFSGGERQLLKIARALTQQPRIILLDEPASHLDLRNKKMLVDIMRKQAAEGVTMLFTTHDPEMASACAGNVVLMRNGTVLRSGSVNEMLEQGLLSETYDSDITVSEIQGKRVALWF
jgi:iron complex transport system ATP-binding protein